MAQFEPIPVGLVPADIVARLMMHEVVRRAAADDELERGAADHLGLLFFEDVGPNRFRLWRRPTRVPYLDQPRAIREYPHMVEVSLESAPFGTWVSVQLRAHAMTRRVWASVEFLPLIPVLYGIGATAWGASWEWLLGALSAAVGVALLAWHTRKAAFRRQSGESGDMVCWLVEQLSPVTLGRADIEASAFRRVVPPA